MEQGPVLVISFYAQQIMAVRNSSGRVMEGDPVSTDLTFCLCLHHIVFCCIRTAKYTGDGGHIFLSNLDLCHTDI